MTLPRLPDNKDSFEAILSRRLALSREPADADCADAAMIAAYCDGSLGTSQRVHWEHHFATCARCQQMLAAVARISANEQQGSRDKLIFARWSWTWRMAPIATAAAIVAFVIVGTHAFRSAEHSSTPTSAVGRLLQSPSAPLMAKGQPKAGTSEFASERPAPVEAPAAGTAGLGGAYEAAENGVPPEATPRHRARHAGESATPSPENAIGSLASSRQPGVVAGSVAVGPPPIQMPASSATPIATNQFETRPPGSLPAQKAGAPAMRAVKREPSYAAGHPSGVVVESPDRSSMWALGPHGSIQHYAAGRGWQAQKSGTQASLTAGSAPSDTTCWAVGAAGTILKTTDGEAWQAINSPTTADLIAIAANSGLDAMITSTSGQQFVTSDGGRNWQPR